MEIIAIITELYTVTNTIINIISKSNENSLAQPD